MGYRDLIRTPYSPEIGLAFYYERLKRLRHRSGKFVVLAAMPKSGSSFLAYALCAALGYEHSYLASSYFNLEQELYLPRIIEGYGRGSVVQQHFKANEPNLRLLNRFGLRPIVLVRNVFDVVVSVLITCSKKPWTTYLRWSYRRTTEHSRMSSKSTS